MTAGEGAPADHPAPVNVRESLLDDVVRSPGTLAALVGVLLLVAWLPATAAFDPTVYCAGALVFLGLVALVVTQGVSSIAEGSRTRLVAVGGAAAFAGWNYASVFWAADRGTAFDGANRTALYATIFALFALTTWTPRLVCLATALFGTGAVLVTAGEFVHTVYAAHPESNFITGRFTPPAGYENASAALLLIGVCSVVVVASVAKVPVVLRAILYGVAVLGVDLAMLAQSRGAAIAIAATMLLLLLVTPNRPRTLVTLLVVAGAGAIAALSLLHVYDASNHGVAAFRDSLHHALRAMIWSTGAGLLVGALWASVDARLLRRRSPRAGRLANGAVLTLVAAAVLAPLVAAAVKPTKARHVATSTWHSFAHGSSPDRRGTRFTTLGSGRYDFYRVMLGEFRAHPLAGVGSDNFAVDYLRERRTDEEPLYPHSDVLRIPTQTGLIGAAVALAVAAALCIAAVRARRLTPEAAVALAAPIAYWAIQGSFDWLWEVAGVTAPVAAWAGAMTSLRASVPRQRRLGILPRVAAVVAVAAVAVPVAAGWFSDHLSTTALRAWRSDPQGALATLDRAARFDPFSDRPNLLAAAIAARVGQPGRMEAELQRAQARNDDNWYTHLLLSVLAADKGAWTAAAAEVGAARRLDPREPALSLVERDVRRRVKPRLRAVEEVFLQRAAQRVRSGVSGAS